MAPTPAPTPAPSGAASAWLNSAYFPKGLPPYGSPEHPESFQLIASPVSILSILLERAARYVQVCNEGGDWDVIDKREEISRNLLDEIRAALTKSAGYDFTKNTRFDQ